MPDIEIEDARSVKAQQAELPLYAPRVKVFPKRIDGTFRRLKWASLILLLGIYYIAPWIRWDRGPGVPDQAFLVDMVGQRAYFLWLETWPQEIYYLAGLLILAAIGLFLITSLFGRLWCGYACPQTVWTDLFMWIERLIEGDRNARIRLDKAPWTAEKTIKRTLKHSTWLLIALLTGGAWIMYFKDAHTLVHDIVNLQVSPTALFFIGLFTSTTYLLGGLAREQVCTYMCPWPRFQSAMFDEDTMVVTYEKWRGEPRGKHKAGEDWNSRGHCIDCNKCVAVCPTGIDIRDGNQLECIGCGLCIDACDSVMEKVGLPKKLICYDTVSCQKGLLKGEPSRYRLIRPRTIIYATLFVVVGLFMLWVLATRSTFDLNIIKDRNPLFVTLSDGSIRNGYVLKILNMDRQDRDFSLEIEGFPGAEMEVMTLDGRKINEGIHEPVKAQLTAEGAGMTAHRVFVRQSRQSLDLETHDLTFRLSHPETGEEVTYTSIFRGPAK